MSRRQPFFQGMTKTELRETIRAELEQYQFGEEFASELISDLIREKHYYCSVARIRPARFRKRFRPGGYDFEGYFEEHGWHRVSWTQCLDSRDEQDWLKRALRDAVHPLVWQYKQLQPICEVCGRAPTEHVDHVQPEFDVIVNNAIAQLSPDQIQVLFEAFNFWSDEPFRIPDYNPAMVLLQDAHRTAILKAVCQPCHVRSARQRRSPQALSESSPQSDAQVNAR